MASKEQLRKIAIYCDSYTPREKNQLKSQTNDNKFESCEKLHPFYRKGKM